MKPTRVTQPPTPPAQAIWTEDNATNGSAGWRVLATANSDDVEVGVFWENLSRANATALAAALIAASEWRGGAGALDGAYEYFISAPNVGVLYRRRPGASELDVWDDELVLPQWRASANTYSQIEGLFNRTLTTVPASDLTDAQRVAL